MKAESSFYIPSLSERRKKSEIDNSDLVGSIVISGMGGRGTTEGARRLKKLLDDFGHKTRPIREIGEISRKAYRDRTGGLEIIGSYDRDPNIDKGIDRKTRELIKTGSSDNLLIVEGQNAAVNALIAIFDSQKKGDKIPPYASFLFVCDPEIAGERVWNRQKYKAQEQGHVFTKTIEDVIRETQERHDNDLLYWWDSVPYLGAKGIDPHDYNNPDARKLYTATLDTSFAPPDVIAMQMYMELIENGMIVHNESKNQLLPGIQTNLLHS